MNQLVYPRERMLGAISLVLGTLVWLGLLAGTLGAALAVLPVGVVMAGMFGTVLAVLAAGFVLYLFAQSMFIAYIRGNGVELSEAQFPDLYAQFTACCERLQIRKRPQVYVLHGGGGLNAFATKFLGMQYVVLMSDVVDAMDKHVDGVRFYIGHELGHLRMKHLNRQFLRWPVLWLPLLGAGYSRARETTCDRHGLACCATPEGAVRALAALSAGAERWKQLDVKAYLSQTRFSSGFWMSFHELTAAYPWLTKRAARVMDTGAAMPRRNPFAYLLAIFVPYAGRMGGLFGLVMLLYVIGVLAAIAIPAYQDYTAKAVLGTAVAETQGARDAIGSYYEAKEEIPESLEVLGLSEKLPDGTQLSLDPDNMVLSVTTPRGGLVFIPTRDASGRIVWSCTNGEGVKEKQLPLACRDDGGQ